MKQTLGFIAGSLVAVGIATGAFFATRTTPAAPGATVFVSGTIEGDVATPVTIFVMARDASVKGHPFLAKRIEAQSLPIEFALTAQDVMAEGQAPAQLQVEARVDRDGDVVTREKDAPKVMVDVETGSKGVVLRLK